MGRCLQVPKIVCRSDYQQQIVEQIEEMPVHRSVEEREVSTPSFRADHCNSRVFFHCPRNTLFASLSRPEESARVASHSRSSMADGQITTQSSSYWVVARWMSEETFSSQSSSLLHFPDSARRGCSKFVRQQVIGKVSYVIHTGALCW